MNTFYGECHFILRWLVFGIILNALVGLSRALYIEIGSFSITWIPSFRMEIS